MSKHLSTRTRWLVLSTLSAFAALVPQASAQIADPPVFECRASAAYVELPSLLGPTTRVEPVIANGLPNSGPSGDNEQCANAEAGLTDVNLLPAGAGSLISLNGAFARTTLTPPLGNARDQNVLSEAGAGPLTITVAGITIQLDSVTAEATADCSGTTAVFGGTSTFVNLRINGLTIPIAANGEPIIPVALAPLVEIALNQAATTGTLGVDRTRVQQALRITLLGLPGTDPLATVVIGEAKAGQNGDTCAAAPPPPTCPGGQVPQNPGGSPLVCVRPPCPAGSTEVTGVCVITVSPPCGAGTTPSGGTCIATPTTCPSGTVRDNPSNACVLVVQRPCPTGSIPDPATRVCVLRVAGRNTNTVSGENGRIGNPNGPVATCGRLSMRFVRGKRSLGSSFTSRFGNRTVTRGKLVTCGANPRPIVRARIDVIHVFKGKRRTKTGLRSREKGLLTLILPIDLRTRNIEYGYRPNLNTSRVTSRVTLRLTVKNKAGRTLR